MIYGLPTTVDVCGKTYNIRTDFRTILEIIGVLNDVELSDQERAALVLIGFYPDIEKMPEKHRSEAIRRCFWFINGGQDQDPNEPKQPQLMDWSQDYPYIIAPVNRVLGHDARSDEYLHWWTFLAAYMEIGECTFAQIVHIRDMQKRGKPLDKSDRAWYNKNRNIVDLKHKYTDAETELLKKWGGGKNG